MEPRVSGVDSRNFRIRGLGLLIKGSIKDLYGLGFLKGIPKGIYKGFRV